jgi:hypothetical protein
MNYAPNLGMALAATVAHLVEGRRVVIFGDCTSDLPDLLIERGARLVHVFDDDLSRVAEASARSDEKDISYAPLGQSSSQRDGAFDFGIILDLATFEDGKKLVTRLRRTLAPRGIALVVSPNPETGRSAPGYYDLYEWVSSEFDEVRMLGQLPFSGAAIVDFGAEGEPDFALDTTFVPPNDQEPLWYLALASHFPVAVDGYTLVQLPAVENDPDGSDPDSTESDEAEAARAASDEAIEALQRSEAQLQAEVERLRKVERATQKGNRDDERAQRLEAALAERDQLLRDLEQRLTEAQKRIEQAEEEATEAQTALDAARRQVEAEKRQVEAEKKRIEAEKKHAEAEVTRRASERADPVELQQAQADVLALEAQLAERGRECQRLEESLRVSEKLAAELLSELDTWKEKSRGARPDASLAELEEELRQAREGEARRVADLTTAQWTIQRLESQLGEARALHDR